MFMKRNVFIQTLLVLLMFSSCKKDYDNYYFNGSVELIKAFPNEMKLTATLVPMEDDFHGQMMLCDSFLLFRSSKYPNNWISTYGLSSKKHLVSFCPKGEGPNDFIYCITSGQFSLEKGNTMLWVHDFISKSCMINVTKSILAGYTVCDSIIPTSYIKKYSYPPTNVFFLSNNHFLVKNRSERTLMIDGYLLPSYKMYKNDLSTEVDVFTIYKEAIKGEATQNNYVEQYMSYDCLKPDQTKIAMAMWRIGQLNILDLQSKELIGYRMQESMSFKDLEDSDFSYRNYYQSLCVNDSYILALYADKLISSWKEESPLLANVIHVFDWNGNPLYKLNLDKNITSMVLDEKNCILYAQGAYDKLYSYDMSFLK